MVGLNLSNQPLIPNTQTEIPFGFKAALGNIPAGTNIVKYAHVIGRASIDIQSGELVHIHNIEGTRGRGDLNQ